MKRIYIGILITVVGSLIFIGWLLDQVASNDSQVEIPIEVTLYQKILQSASTQLDTLDATQLVAYVPSLNAQFDLAFSLEPSANLALPQELQQELTRSGNLMLQFSDSTQFYSRLSAHPEFLLKLTMPEAQEHTDFLDIALTLALYTGLGIALLLWLLPLTSRLALMNKVAAKFGAGKLDSRITPSRFSYITALESSFNRMASQIESLVADNKLMADSLSHDLRTPLACLRFGVEAALEAKDPIKQQHYLERIEEELSRMESMLEAFLSYASMERHAQGIVLEDTDLLQLLQSAVDEMHLLADDCEMILSFDASQPLIVKLDHQWFYRAIINLIANGLDHAKSKLMITLGQEGNVLLLGIHDDGEGIPVDKRTQIFTPFVTADTSRNRQTTSYGLGLAIVKKVMHWHKADINATESELLGGACFVIQLNLSA